MPPSPQLPDDIEQRLLDGQRVRATRDLMARRGINLGQATTLIAQWLLAHAPGSNTTASIQPRPNDKLVPRMFSRRRTDRRLDNT